MGFFFEHWSYSFCSYTGKFFTGKRGKLSVMWTSSTRQTVEKSRTQVWLSEKKNPVFVLFSNISVNFSLTVHIVMLLWKSLSLSVFFFFAMTSLEHEQWFLITDDFKLWDPFTEIVPNHLYQPISFLLSMPIADNL